MMWGFFVKVYWEENIVQLFMIKAVLFGGGLEHHSRIHL